MPSRRLLGAVTLAFVSLLCIGLLEVGLSVLAPVPDPYAHMLKLNSYIRSGYPPDFQMIVTLEDGLPGVSGKTTIRTNNVGMRGPDLAMPKPHDEYRVVMVGGSTTECAALTEQEGIHSVLQAHLSEKTDLGKTIRVYNAGVSGHKSDDHISWIAHRIAHLKPDMVVVFAGINDLLAAIRGFDYLHIDMPPQSRGVLARMVSTKFQIPRRMFYFYNRISSPSDQDVMERIGAYTNYHEKIALRKNAPLTDDLPRTAVAPYKTNLSTIAGMARVHGFKLVLMTQQSTWVSDGDPEAADWHWLRYWNGKTFHEEPMHAALEEYNHAMREVGARLEVPVYDLAANCPKSIDYFYDDVHFNVKGAAEAGRSLADFIVDNELLPASGTAAAPAESGPTD